MGETKNEHGRSLNSGGKKWSNNHLANESNCGSSNELLLIHFNAKTFEQIIGSTIHSHRHMLVKSLLLDQITVKFASKEDQITVKFTFKKKAWTKLALFSPLCKTVQQSNPTKNYSQYNFFIRFHKNAFHENFLTLYRLLTRKLKKNN